MACDLWEKHLSLFKIPKPSSLKVTADNMTISDESKKKAVLFFYGLFILLDPLEM